MSESTIVIMSRVFKPATLKAIYRHANNIAHYCGDPDHTLADVMNDVRATIHSGENRRMGFDLSMCTPETIHLIDIDLFHAELEACADIDNYDALDEHERMVIADHEELVFTAVETMKQYRENMPIV